MGSDVMAVNRRFSLFFNINKGKAPLFWRGF